MASIFRAFPESVLKYIVRVSLTQLHTLLVPNRIENALQSPHSRAKKGEQCAFLLTASRQEIVYQPNPKRSGDFALGKTSYRLRRASRYIVE
jgi:hypothetical protein